jgi:signal transduction histidine kinase
MNTHGRPAVIPARSGFKRLGLGGFSLLLALLLILMLAGLVAADSVLSASDDDQAQTEAAHAARALEFQLVSRSEGLAAFGALASVAASGVASGTERTEDFRRLASAYAAAHPGCLYFGIIDRGGQSIYGEAFGSPRSAAQSGAIERILRNANATLPRRRQSWTTVVDRASILAMTHRLDARGPDSAIAIALFDVPEIAGRVLPPLAHAQDGLAVMSGSDTLWSRTILASGGSVAEGQTSVDLPFGAAWMLGVSREASTARTRAALWLLGSLTVVLLASGVIRERRQATRVAERSAELERLSAELLRANRMKSEFLANVSHELRTPLNAIVGFVELLKDGVYGSLSPRQVGPVDRIAVSATHLRHLVDQVLDIAKIAAGRIEIHSESVNLRTFVLNVASELESLFSERGLSFSIAVPATLPRVRTDPMHLRQILINLLGNAVSYTPAGSVAIRARVATAQPPARKPEDDVLQSKGLKPNGNWVALQVTDTGVGIAPADHDRIFDEFERVTTATRGDATGRGTGLGLPISRRLARLLGGDLTVESEPGRGSTFTVWLAVDATDIAPAAPPSAKASLAETVA